METLLRIAVWNVALGAALGGLAFAVSRSTRRPALAHGLWVLALLKLLTPPLWTIGVATPANTFVPETERTMLLPSRSSLAAPSPVIATPDSRAAVPHRTASERVARRLVPALCIAWGSGSLACLAITLARIRQFRRAVGHASTDTQLQRRVEELAAEIGLRRSPATWLIPGRVCPMVWWTFGRPRLLVPVQLWSEMTEAKRDALIVHELAHVKRRDHWVRVIELLATVVYWWDPLVWWVRHELRIAEEQCCDAWVAQALPSSGPIYASALVDAIDFVSSSGSISSPRLPALASGTGEFRHLQRRLVMIQQGTSIRPLGRTGFSIICAAALVLPLSLTRGQSAGRDSSAPAAHDKVTAKSPATQPSDDEDSASSALLNRMIPEVRFDDVAFSDVIDFLRDVSGANLFVNWKSLEAAGITKNAAVSVQLKNVKFSKALDMVLDSVAGGQVRLAYFSDNNVLTITTADNAAKNTVTRVYDVKDLVSASNARIEELIKAITNSCAADTWKANGGSVGAISPVDTMLVVVQTEENQRLVKDLLAKTRRAKQEASGK